MKVLRLASKNTENNDKSLDFPMLVTIIILLCLGLIMVATASSYYALNNYGDSNYFLSRQAIFAVIGVVAMIIISKIDYKIYKKWAYIGYGVALALLAAVLIPGIGKSSNGATRWLGFGSFRFQPSEIMKIMLVIAISTYIVNNRKKLNTLKGYLVPILLLGAVVVVMFLQKHMSGTIVMCVAACSIIFASGINIKPKYVIIGIVVIVVAFVIFISAEEFRAQRIFSFLNPEEDIRGGNWQAAQSIYAIGSGGIFGRGLGQSRQKYLWLPEAQTDFIFSVLGEEFGIVGSITVLGIFTFFIYRGYKIAMTCKDMYGSMIASGIVSVFAFQIMVNLAVVTCSMPVTGMPLPFFSYGGTALFINLCAMGILLSISRNCSK